MISIIVSSYKLDLFNKFSESLDASIGVPYELIRIENNNQYCLSKAYNLGGNKANFDILCFIHEDVTFLTQDWGKRLLELFGKIDNLGIVGLAGSKKKSYLPTGWGTGTSIFDRINLVQESSGNKIFQSSRVGLDSFEEIRVLDGVFLATSKNIWEEIRFDESLNGFHLYDIDFSLRVTNKYIGILTYDILLIHFSEGGYNSDWLDCTLKYHQRNDKKHLFDGPSKFDSKFRRAWFKFLLDKNISKESRKEYQMLLGSDLTSFVHSFCFNNPVIGKPILRSFILIISIFTSFYNTLKSY